MSMLLLHEISIKFKDRMGEKLVPRTKFASLVSSRD